MDTKIIEYILAIAEEKSLSRAAQRLYLTQPALSQRLKKLEDELGVPLFIRDSSGFSITDAGRIYINGARSIMQIKQTALKRIANMEHSDTASLHFGCATSSALECIPTFHKLYPDIELSAKRCTSSEAKEALIMGHLDVAVLLTNTLQNQVLEYLPLSKNELLLSIPESNPVSGQSDPFSHGYDCLKNDYFILSPKFSYARELEDQALAQMGLQPHILCELSDNASRRYMLNKNLGNSFLPSYSIEKEDTFSTWSLEPKLTFHIVAAYRKNTVLSPPTKDLLNLLLTHFTSRQT